jgi:hypothetical protein
MVFISMGMPNPCQMDWSQSREADEVGVFDDQVKGGVEMAQEMKVAM